MLPEETSSRLAYLIFYRKFYQIHSRESDGNRISLPASDIKFITRFFKNYRFRELKSGKESTISHLTLQVSK